MTFDHITQLTLTLVSEDVDSIVNNTITFLMQDYQNMNQQIFGHKIPLEQVSASHNADTIINDTTTFLRSR